MISKCPQSFLSVIIIKIKIELIFDCFIVFPLIISIKIAFFFFLVLHAIPYLVVVPNEMISTPTVQYSRVELTKSAASDSEKKKIKLNVPDPYVKIYLLFNNQRIAKKKTHVKKRTLNPVFNESFVFDLPKSEDGLASVQLEFMLLDWDRVTKNEVGNCRLWSYLACVCVPIRLRCRYIFLFIFSAWVDGPESWINLTDTFLF